MKLTSVLILSMMATLPGIAQDQSAPPAPANQSGGWRKFNPATDGQAQGQPSAEAPLPPEAGDPQDQPPPPPPPQGAYQQGAPPQRGYQGPYQQPAPAPRYAPSTITLPAGTWVTIRVNEPLSSDHNQTGDAFTGTLLEPVIANGLLIARRGATVTGIVTEAQKAGRV